MTEQYTIPVFGADRPAILGSDTLEDITNKIHECLADVRDAFTIEHQRASESGEAECVNYAPGCTVRILAAYEGPESSPFLLANLNAALIIAVNALSEYGFFLQDVNEWERANLADDDGRCPYGYTVGAFYTVRIGSTRGEETYRQLSGKEWDKAHATVVSQQA